MISFCPLKVMVNQQVVSPSSNTSLFRTGIKLQVRYICERIYKNISRVYAERYPPTLGLKIGKRNISIFYTIKYCYIYNNINEKYFFQLSTRVNHRYTLITTTQIFKCYYMCLTIYIYLYPIRYLTIYQCGKHSVYC